MANILAIETSTENCSVSIGKGSEVFSFHENIPKQHTEKIFGVISDLLDQSGLSYKGLNAVAVGIGPGSYTGIRLSCAVAQGIAFSQSLKCITLSSLELLSIEANLRFAAKEVIAISEINLGKVYIAESCFEGGEIQSKFRFIQQEQFNIEEFSGSCYFVGAGCSLFPEVNNHLPGAYPSAENLLMIARKKLNKNELVKPEEILPIYLNDENSWKKLK